MARTLQSSGPATTLQFLGGVDDDNATIRIFKSLDGSSVDNTSAVNSGKAVDGTVSVSTMTWNGHTIPYFTRSPTTGDWVTFPTDKPNIAGGSGGDGIVTTYLFVGRTPVGQDMEDHVFGSNPQADGGTAVPEITIINIGGTKSATLRRKDTSNLMWSAGAAATTTDQTWAFVYNSTSGQTCKCYIQNAGTAITATETTRTSPGLSVSGAFDYFGGINTSANFRWEGRIALAAVFSGEVSLADLAAIHDDPYGATLFASAATAKPHHYYAQQRAQAA